MCCNVYLYTTICWRLFVFYKALWFVCLLQNVVCLFTTHMFSFVYYRMLSFACLLQNVIICMLTNKLFICLSLQWVDGHVPLWLPWWPDDEAATGHHPAHHCHAAWPQEGHQQPQLQLSNQGKHVIQCFSNWHRGKP